MLENSTHGGALNTRPDFAGNEQMAKPRTQQDCQLSEKKKKKRQSLQMIITGRLRELVH
jgi:hypothetical protein